MTFKINLCLGKNDPKRYIVWDYISSEGTFCGTTDYGNLSQERIFNTMAGLNRFMRECEHVYGGDLNFIMRPWYDEIEKSDKIIIKIRTKNNK